MSLVPITEFDIIFISYDEPNADNNYADLLDKCPWAKRSHGVWGSDAAHKAAAAMSDTASRRFCLLPNNKIPGTANTGVRIVRLINSSVVIVI